MALRGKPPKTGTTYRPLTTSVTRSRAIKQEVVYRNGKKYKLTRKITLQMEIGRGEDPPGG